MSWNQGGGPWGGGGGGGQSPWGRVPQPPNLEEILRKGQDRLRRFLPGGKGKGNGIVIAALAVAVVWLLWSGVYTVAPDEQGIVLRFGAYDRTTNPGLNFKLPLVETALTPKVTRVSRVEVGFRQIAGERQSRATELPEESLMLTGDENIVDINFIVLWVIKDAKSYLFNIRNPDGTVKSAAESAMREVIGHSEIASALTSGRPKIEADTQQLLQEILDSYHAGISIDNVQLQKVDPPNQVIDAFRDVQSAKIDQNRLINEAEAYRNNVVPVAKGDGARLVQEAEAYRQQVVLNAQGDAARFLSVYDSYRVAADITSRRLYIETMESILGHTNKIILDKAAASSGVVPYLPLPQIQSAPPPRAANPQAPQGAVPAPAQAPAGRGGTQ
ncbi:MAG TPA: FtsH protease activity modulator HflK [Stellaceae bacterium]|nr:FtsH protease activity modulator HflK [Stellaceae bacterium]